MGMGIQAPAVTATAADVGWAFVNGGESFSDGTNNYFTAWFDTPCGDGGIVRRHIVCRIVVPLDVARRIRDQATKVWTAGAH